jgi:hypothetical protein
MSKTLVAGRCAALGGAAMLLSLATAPVHAQGLPQGSYLRSCTHVAIYGDRLLADCRLTDGSWGRTALRDVDRCVGDIGNMNGQLACNRGNHGYGWRDRDYRQSPGYGYSTGPGYGSSRGGWPPERHWPPAGYPSDYGR